NGLHNRVCVFLSEPAELIEAKQQLLGILRLQTRVRGDLRESLCGHPHRDELSEVEKTVVIRSSDVVDDDVRGVHRIPHTRGVSRRPNFLPQVESAGAGDTIIVMKITVRQE